MVSFLGFVLVSFMLVYVNSLFYSLAVIGVSSSVMFFVVMNAKMSILVFIFFVIVYVGAMMIFIGYICAVSPNFVVSSGYSFLVVLLLVVVGSGLSMLSIDQTQVFSKNMVLVEYFYSMWGGALFVLVIVFMFVVLIMVTSQYIFPKGPFRSLD